jgi:acyl carrier protein
MQRTAATPSQPAQQQPRPQQRQAPEQDSVEYMRRRAIEIVGEAQQEFGVKVDVSTLDEAAWESEDAFYRAVMRSAAHQSQNGEADVPRKPPANETPQQMQQRIRREIQDELGVSSPNGPKGTSRATKKPTEEDVRSLVNGYQSAKGPKAQAQKLREMRERMG